MVYLNILVPPTGSTSKTDKDITFYIPTPYSFSAKDTVRREINAIEELTRSIRRLTLEDNGFPMFMKLPLELRQKIYCFAMASDKRFTITLRPSDITRPTHVSQDLLRRSIRTFYPLFASLAMKLELKLFQSSFL